MKYMILTVLLLTGCSYGKFPWTTPKEKLFILGACNRNGCTPIVVGVTEDECHDLADSIIHLHRDLLKDQPVAVIACLKERP